MECYNTDDESSARTNATSASLAGYGSEAVLTRRRIREVAEIKDKTC
jgi:hypothetical protein